MNRMLKTPSRKMRMKIEPNSLVRVVVYEQPDKTFHVVFQKKTKQWLDIKFVESQDYTEAVNLACSLMMKFIAVFKKL